MEPAWFMNPSLTLIVSGKAPNIPTNGNIFMKGRVLIFVFSNTYLRKKKNLPWFKLGNYQFG